VINTRCDEFISAQPSPVAAVTNPQDHIAHPLDPPKRDADLPERSPGRAGAEARVP